MHISTFLVHASLNVMAYASAPSPHPDRSNSDMVSSSGIVSSTAEFSLEW